MNIRQGKSSYSSTPLGGFLFILDTHAVVCWPLLRFNSNDRNCRLSPKVLLDLFPSFLVLFEIDVVYSLLRSGNLFVTKCWCISMERKQMRPRLEDEKVTIKK